MVNENELSSFDLCDTMMKIDKGFPMYIILFFFLAGCSHHKDSNVANKHMHQSSHAHLVKVFDDPARDLKQKPEVVMKFIAPLRGLKVIDIGVGSGYFSKHLLNAGALVTGADVDEKFLAVVSEKFPKKDYPNFGTLKIDYDDPKMPQSSYDVAFTSNTYHHIEDRVSYLRKVLSGLKTSGRVVVFDFKKDSGAVGSGPPNELRIHQDQVVTELKEAGFKRTLLNTSDFEDHYLIIGSKF